MARAALVLLMAVGLAACGDSTDGDLPETLEETRERLDMLIGDAAASDVSQCRLLGLGARPCGGPSLYLAYSAEQTDSAQLTLLAQVYTMLEERRTRQLGLAGICALLPAPDLDYQGGRCVTTP